MDAVRSDGPRPGRALPFEVEAHALMPVRVAGKDGTTVLTIERNIYNFKVCEYDGPLSFFRQWCYPDYEQAYVALVRYLIEPEATELAGWTRAIDMEHGERHPERAVRYG